MSPTPKHFAELLKASTLDASEQQALLNLLPTLNEDQIAELTKILETDNKNQQRAFENAESKRDEILLRFGLDVQQIEKESEEK